MKKISAHRKELLEIIAQLKNADDFFCVIGDSNWCSFLDEEKEIFEKAENLLIKSITRMTNLLNK